MGTQRDRDPVAGPAIVDPESPGCSLRGHVDCVRWTPPVIARHAMNSPFHPEDARRNDVGGAREDALHVREFGKGPVIVLLHAFPLNGRMWEPQIRELGTGNCLVVPDLPGFGLSAHLGTPSTIDGYAERVRAEIGSRLREPVLLVGASLGGMIAMTLAPRLPALRSLVFVGVSAVTDPRTEAARRRRLAAEIEALGVDAAADALLPRLLGFGEARRRGDLFDEVRRMVREARPDGVAAALRAMSLRPPSLESLLGVSCPMRWVVGADDRIASRDEVLQVARLLPNSVCEVVPRVGHLVNLEAPERFNEILRTALVPLRRPD